MRTAKELAAVCEQLSVPFIFRAGVWKPRTRPHTFQGVGEEGLAWLEEVKRTYGVPVATEVATPEHVTAALKAGIDYLWIGARTSANPIAVPTAKSPKPSSSRTPSMPMRRCGSGILSGWKKQVYR